MGIARNNVHMNVSVLILQERVVVMVRLESAFQHVPRSAQQSMQLAPLGLGEFRDDFEMAA